MNIFKILLINTIFFASLQADVKHFTELKDALNTFILALENRDKETLSDLFTKRYIDIIKGKDIDSDDLKRFLKFYKISHRLASFDGKEVYIEVGAKKWLFPIPLLKDKDGWYFDLDIGVENILIREIGKNELAVIEALKVDWTLEELQANSKLNAYSFKIDQSGILFAQPKEYNRSAIMTFALIGDGKLYEADLAEEECTFDNRFKEVDISYLK